VSGGATAHPTTGHCRIAKVNRTDAKWFCLNDLRGKDNGREIAKYLAQVKFPSLLGEWVLKETFHEKDGVDSRSSFGVAQS
jgi:hypothetical protein